MTPDGLLRRDMARASPWHPLALACLGGVVLRILAVALIPTQPVSDFYSYLRNAAELLDRGRYPEPQYPPGYSVFLDLCFLFVSQGTRLAAAKVGNVLLGGITIGLCGVLARRLWGARAGAAAAALAAVCPLLVLLPCLLASENLFLPLFLGLALLILRSWDTDRALGGAAAAGVLVGMAALVRALAALAGGFWLLGLFVRGKRPRAVLLEAMLLLAVQYLVMVPWGLLNLREHGRFTFRTTSGGTGLFIGNNPWATGTYSFDWPQQLRAVDPSVGTRTLDDYELDDAAGRAAQRWMREEPWRAARLYVVKLAHCLKGTDEITFWAIFATDVAPPDSAPPVLEGPHLLKRHPQAVHRVALAAPLVSFAFALAGLVLALLRARQAADPRRAVVSIVLLCAMALYSPAVSSVFVATGRYRWPTEVFALLFAGLAVAALLDRRDRDQLARSAGTSAVPTTTR